MKPAFCVIDIGSNSVRLMLGTERDGRAVSLKKTLCTTRLAAGLNETHLLREDRMEASIRAIERFSDTAAEYGIPVLAYATSAVRDAGNREAFLDTVKHRTGIDVLVLSGAEEGKLAFAAVMGGTGTVFDIGGGSFQVVTSENALSFPCGCVRAKDRCDASDPQTLERELFRWMDENARLPETVPTPVYGVGGTISSIGALLAGQQTFDIAGLSDITLQTLDDLIRRLCAVPERERLQHPLLHERGDVILQGAMILRYLMVRTHTDTVRPSVRDGMEGIAEALLLHKGSAHL